MIPEPFENDRDTENLPPERPSNSTQDERKSNRPTQSPKWTHDYHMLLAVSNIDNPIVSENPPPQTVTEALQSPDKKLWTAAINKELKSFEDNNVWKLVERTPNIKPIHTKWVFKIKTNSKNNTNTLKPVLAQKVLLNNTTLIIKRLFHL